MASRYSEVVRRLLLWVSEAVGRRGRRVQGVQLVEPDAVRAERDQLAAMVSSGPQISFQLRGDLGCRWVSPQAEPLLGRPLGDWAIPGFFREAVDTDDRLRLLALCESILEGRAEARAEFRLRTAEGRAVWVAGSFCGAGGGPEPREVRGYLLPIARRAQTEAELQLAQKLESLGRLAAGISHEINTPVQFVSDGVYFANEAATDLLQLLAAYRTHAEALPPAVRADLAHREVELDLAYLAEHLPRALQRASEGLERVATVARSMKEFAHPDPTEMTAVDLNRSLKTTLVIARNEYRYVAELETDFGEVGEVRCFAGEINQVVLNLLINAAQAVAEQVAKGSPRGTIGLRTYRDAGSVVIAVSDTGPGIPPEVRARIFEPFFTTKPPGKGSGQGLALAQAVVVEKHGGQLSFETEVGKGTTFFVRLPLEGGRSRLEQAA